MEWCVYCRKHVDPMRMCRNPDMSMGCVLRDTHGQTAGRRVYFAHPMVDYDTRREAAAMQAIQTHMGPESDVVNPNVPEHQAGYEARGDFAYWTELARSCGTIVFMAMPGGHWIGSGVWKEVDHGLVHDCRVFEVGRDAPFRLERVVRLDPERLLTVDETRRWTKIMLAAKEGR